MNRHKFLAYLASPFVLAAAWIVAGVRKSFLGRMPVVKRIFYKVGVWPILDHFYEPLFNPAHLKKSLRVDRDLPGIDMNDDGQLALLERFAYAEELVQFPLEKQSELEFYYHNGTFAAGDAEFYYNLIRSNKPKRIIEIGGGHSTLMACNAVKKNSEEDPGYKCRQTAIDPFESGRCEALGVEIVREMVENVDKSLFQTLAAGDILFIDSSHIIRPQGDVLFECLEILPTLRSGVFVHVHDVFTPRDILDPWLIDDVRLWNEQYLLEAFLSCNREFRVVGALNYLKYHHPEAFAAKCPVFGQEIHLCEPGSFWLEKV